VLDVYITDTKPKFLGPKEPILPAVDPEVQIATDDSPQASAAEPALPIAPISE
jgi:hypothetical protein